MLILEHFNKKKYLPNAPTRQHFLPKITAIVDDQSKISGRKVLYTDKNNKIKYL